MIDVLELIFIKLLYIYLIVSTILFAWVHYNYLKVHRKDPKNEEALEYIKSYSSLGFWGILSWSATGVVLSLYWLIDDLVYNNEQNRGDD